MFQFIRTFFNRNLSSELFTPSEIRSLMYPIIVDQTFIVGMALFNTAMISSSGMAAVSAVNMVEALNIFLISIFVALSTGGTVLVAQARGKRDTKLVKRSAINTLLAVFFFGVFCSILMIVFHKQVLTILFGQSSKAVMLNARIYFIGSVLSYPGLAIVEAACGILRGVADTRTSFILSFATNMSYVCLNILFILGFHWGIVGMAIALVIARSVGGILAIFQLVYRNQGLGVSWRGFLQKDFAMIKRVFAVGIPFAAEQLFFNGGKMITQIFVVGMGTLALTSNAVANSLALLMEIFAGSLMIGIVPIVGQSVGAGDYKSVRKFTRAFIYLASILTVLSGVLLLSCYPWIIKLFHVPTSVERTVFVITVIVFLFKIIIWPLSFITPAALRAAGDANFTSLVSLCSMWGVRIVLGYIIGVTMNYGVIGVWTAMCLEWIIRSIIFTHRLKHKKWEKKKLV